MIRSAIIWAVSENVYWTGFATRHRLNGMRKKRGVFRAKIPPQAGAMINSRFIFTGWGAGNDGAVGDVRDQELRHH